MPAPDASGNLTPGLTAAGPVPPRNERRRARTGLKSWVWQSLGLVGASMVACAVSLPLAVLPLVGRVTYADDNAARAKAMVDCAVAAMVCFAGRWHRLAALCNGLIAGLLLASVLEKYQDWQTLRASTRLPAGAGEMARQAAAMTAQTLAGIRPEIGAYLLPAGLLLGIVAGLAGRRSGGFATSARQDIP